MSETELARAANTAILAFLEIANGSERRASALLFSVACHWALDLGVPPLSLTDALFTEMRKRDTETENGNG